VITIHPAAGIEAGVPIITLDESFYNLSGIISATCSDPLTLFERIALALSGQTHDAELQRHFIAALKNEYEVQIH